VTPEVPTSRSYLARFGGAWPLIPVAIFAIFVPALIVSFGFSDDYATLSIADGLGGRAVTGTDIPGGFFGTNILNQTAGNGRPLAGLLDDVVFPAAGTIDNLRFVRLITVIGIVALGLLLYWAIVRSGIRSGPATLIAVLICAMPAFQVYASWAIVFNAPYASVLAGLASVFASRAVDGPRHFALDRLIGAGALMLAALLIYQPAAMVFWVFLAIALAGAVAEPGRARALVAAHASAGLVALAVGYLALKSGYAGKVGINGRAGLTTDVIGKARWFVSNALYEALNLGNVSPTVWLATVVAVLAVVGVPLYLLKAGARNPLFLTAIAVVLVPLTYLPNLVVRDDIAYYRTEPALSAIIAVYAAAGAVGIWQTLRDWLEPRATAGSLHAAACVAGVAALAAIATSVFLAARNELLYFVIPQSVELRLVRHQVAALPTGVQRVAFSGTPYNIGLSPIVRYDEFGLPSTAHPFVYAPLVLLLLDEEGRLTPPPYPIVDILSYPVSSFPKNEPVINIVPELNQLH
jgi:hypothetical protein